jgi:hypothetical protein
MPLNEGKPAKITQFGRTPDRPRFFFNCRRFPNRLPDRNPLIDLVDSGINFVSRVTDA